MANKLQWMLVVVVSMVLGAGIIIGIDELRGDDSNGGSTAVVEDRSSNGGASEDNGSVPVVQRTPSDVADLVEDVRPSVVLINTSSARGVGSGIGSGVVLDRDGYILTNNHVISNFDLIDVTLWDGTKSAARVIGRDPGNDLALIKVDDIPDEKLRPARLGNSDGVRIGEMVVAIGNPFGRTGSVTEGIVSGLDRRLEGGTGRPLRQLIQTDAAINPGNSGGALFNAKGEVIGITTAIENPSGDRVFAGIGYAVPINIANREMDALMAGETIQHPRLGVSILDLTPSLARELDLPVEEGLIVTTVDPNSAAGKAGIRASRSYIGADVIIDIDGTKISNYDDLARFLDTKQVGDTVDVKVIRDGREVTVSVTLEAWADNTV